MEVYMNYTMYHLHSDYSLLDSCTNYKEYIDYAVSLRQKAIAFTEHGKPMGWVAKKKYCDEKKCLRCRIGHKVLSCPQKL